MTAPATVPEASCTRLLDQITDYLGHPPAPAWQEALRATPRHCFLPAKVWVRDGRGGHDLCDQEAEPERWMEAAYTNTPLVTSWRTTSDGVRNPASSASAPGTVLQILEAADLHPGMSALEIGAGTGFSAGLLAHRLGDARVTTLDCDAGLVATATASLAALDRHLAVICADGALGWQPRAPYERIIATCSVRTPPAAWLEQLADGGRLVTPWDTSWINYGTLTLTKSSGRASGHFSAGGSYMVIRGQQQPCIDLDRDVLRPDQAPETSTTRLSPWQVAGEDLDAQFAIGLLVPGAWHSWEAEPDDADVQVRLWLADDSGTSWACVDYDGHRADRFTVRQYGARRLWTEVAKAHAWWRDAGAPTIDRFGLTLATIGHALWLDDPSNRLPQQATHGAEVAR